MTRVQTYPWESAPTGSASAMSDRLAELLPGIETARLVLRAPRITDFEAYGRILMTERARYMGGPFDRKESWLDFTQCTAGWLLRGHGLWTTIRKEDEAILGFVLVNLEYGDLEPELGYFFLEEAEGAGFAFEAAEAARNYAFNETGLSTLVSYIDPDNTRSITLAIRLGATRDPEAAFPDEDPCLVYRHHSGKGQQ